MLKLGLIGTSQIAYDFVSTAQKIHQFQLTTVYSRTLEHAIRFGKPFGATHFFKNLEEFFKSHTFDTIYIASPNDLHFKQVKLAIQYNKHIIVEKPAFANPKEMQQINRLLKQHPKIYFFEAMRTLHEPNYQVIKHRLSLMPIIQGATLNYQKYSSKYDNFRVGGSPNVFTPQHAGGALQDLGVYLVYDAIGWFGMPQQAHYFPIKFKNGIDSYGTAILKYPMFQVLLNVGKTFNSYLPSEIYGLKETLTMDNAADLNQLGWYDHDHIKHSLGNIVLNHLEPEINDFAQMIKQASRNEKPPIYQSWLRQAQQVNQLLFQLRTSAQLYFPNDNQF